MTFWRAEHQALLDAMRADDLVPSLVARLTFGQTDVSDRDARRWRGWALALSDTDAGRRMVELRHNEAAWPAAWERAEEAGFSARADHHSALLFRELFHRLSESGSVELSLDCWRRSLRAWMRLERTTYLAELGSKLVEGTSTDPVPIVAELLAPDIAFLLAELTRSLRLGADEFAEIDAVRARWAWDCLDQASAMIGEDGESHLIERTRTAAMEAKAYVVASVTTRFRRAAEEIDWADGDAAAITAPFLWLSAVSDVVEHRENVASIALKEVIDGAWKLRKLERDDEEAFKGLISAGEPFATVIVDRLDSGGAFGQGSRAADYLVFCGEIATEKDVRRGFFQRALELSPGHRNASLLYSYEHLIDVETMLAQIGANPALMTRVPVVGEAVENMVRRAWALCNEVERLYPYNSRLEDTRARVRAEADRLGISLPETDDE